MNEQQNNNNCNNINDLIDYYEYDESITDYIEVLYNSCAGCFSISELAINMYNDEMLKIDENFKLLTKYNKYDIQRNDPLLIKIFYQLGKKINGKHASIMICRIPKKYENCYSIVEHEGTEQICFHKSLKNSQNSEHIEIDNYKYAYLQLHKKINDILQNNISNDEKINKLNKLNEYVKSSLLSLEKNFEFSLENNVEFP